MTALTRRAALATTARAALAVAAGGGVAVAALPPEGDEALHALAADLRAALAAREAAGALSSAASDRLYAALPKLAAGEAPSAGWKADWDRLYDECGVTASEDEFNARCSAVCDIARCIAQTPAATLAGVRIKLSLKEADHGLLQICGGQGETLAEDLVISIAADFDRWASV